MCGEAKNKEKALGLWQITGEWISTYGSPPINIYSNGKEYFIEVHYKMECSFILPIYQINGQTFFYLFGTFSITYNQERDHLIISEEGVYIRSSDN